LLLAVCALVGAMLAPMSHAAERARGTSSGSEKLRYIVVFKQAIRDPGRVASRQAREVGARVLHRYRFALKGYGARLSETEVGALRADPRVSFVARDRRVRLTAAPALPPTCPIQPLPPDISQCLPTGVDRIDADESSSRAGDGKGRVKADIAIIDTGIDLDHPDLNVVGGVACAPGGGFGPLAGGHGTHVAGTAAARDNAIGVVGVAPGARLWSVRVFPPTGDASLLDVICGIDWVTGTRLDRDPSNDIDVANMSLGAPGSDDPNCGQGRNDAIGVLHRAICRSVRGGVTHVVAAGNEQDDLAHHVPAAFNQVLTVTAMADYDGEPGGEALIPRVPTCLPGEARPLPPVDPDDAAALSFSNFATTRSDRRHTVAAPGECIVSTYPDDRYDVSTGTSMASPHAAGTAALCIAEGPCEEDEPLATIRRIRRDAKKYNLAHPGYGFLGDPLRPIDGRYFGFLIRTGLY
jgi:subtilisin